MITFSDLFHPAWDSNQDESCPQSHLYLLDILVAKQLISHLDIFICETIHFTILHFICKMSILNILFAKQWISPLTQSAAFHPFMSVSFVPFLREQEVCQKAKLSHWSCSENLCSHSSKDISLTDSSSGPNANLSS